MNANRNRTPRTTWKPLVAAAVVAVGLAACQQPLELADQIEKAVEENKAGNETSIPVEPGDFEANTVIDSPNDVRLTWDDRSDNETSFQLQRKLASDTTWENVVDGGIDADATSQTDEGLLEDTQYDYRIRAVNNGGASDWVTDSVTTGVVVPSAPADVTATASGTDVEISVTWTDTSGNETEFDIRRRTGSTGDFSAIATVGAGSTSYLDTTVSDGTTYSYQVRAENAGGTSDWIGPGGAGTATTLMRNPTSLNASGVTSTRIDLTWVNQSATATKIEVERKHDGGFTPFAVLSASTTSNTDTNVDSESTYTYRLRASNDDGSVTSEWVQDSATTPKLDKPTGVVARAVGASQINVTWNDNSEGETGFEVWRGLDLGTMSHRDTLPAGATTYSDTGLSSGFKFSYEIRAIDNGGNGSDFSSTADVDYLIAQSGPGDGFVFYDKGSYSDGWRYMEAAPTYTDENFGYFNDWGSNPVPVYDTAVGTGEDNTDTLAQHEGWNGNYAATLCYDLGAGGYSDWFLPSRDELQLIGDNLHAKGYGEMWDYYYWSSSLESEAQEEAWYVYFYSDGASAAGDKTIDTGYRVRCARQF
ncbi:MAG: DUF1566 domain-containing protein [Spirochaetes bacterium]|jgi:hypothetical protein|nr:DUF1566 domain-containing protein [Spirochaetota bacterium]